MVDVSGTPLAAQRVGDQERQRTAEILADHHAQGRLSPEEFETRLGAAFAAETTTDLGRVLADLPLRPAAPLPPRVPSELGWILVGFAAVLAFGVLVGVVIQGGPWWIESALWVLRDHSTFFLVVLVAAAVGFVVGRASGRRH